MNPKYEAILKRASIRQPKKGPTRRDLLRARSILQPTAARTLGCFDYLVAEVAKALRYERDTAIKETLASHPTSSETKKP